MKNFARWWREEGSAMRPMPTEDVEEFAKRIAMTAWSNGAYIFAKQPEPVPGAFNPSNFDAIATIATPPAAARKPLTDEIVRLAGVALHEMPRPRTDWHSAAKLVCEAVAAHGIKEPKP
jgi:hypothetical protein